MQRYALGLEAIDDDANAALSHLAKRLPKHMKSNVRLKGRKPWVAKITGLSGSFGFRREFLEGQYDYSRAYGSGARGVFVHFWLETRQLYEVCELQPTGQRRRFVVTDGKSLMDIPNPKAFVQHNRGGRL